MADPDALPTPAPSAALVEDILGFWFGTPGPAGRLVVRGEWFRADPAFDEAVRTRFGLLCRQGADGALDPLAASARGALALVLVLDQFPRNIHRGTPAAFATDDKARAHAGRAIDAGWDQVLQPVECLFLYLPFEHSENLADQDRCCALMAALGVGRWTEYAEKHRDVIVRFGRFPHRNRILGRPSTAAEEAFLKDPGSSF
jgi:uncharacterized protein (DUF924 family)